jgi:glycosyltransferase involved in cell wall biosynthesis
LRRYDSNGPLLDSRMRPPYRLAIISTHPIQYHAPWFRGLASHPELETHVYYCHTATPDEQARAGFGVGFDWDVPLLSGYPNSFLQNIARPAGHGRFAGFDTPEIGKILREGRYDAVLVNGWNYKSAWQAIWAAWQSDVRVLVRGDSHLHSPRSRPVRWTKLLAYRRFVPRFDACLAAGVWSHEYFAYYGARRDRIFFVPHVVDTEYMTLESQRVQAKQSELRRQWGLRENSVVFLFVGKFTETKRPLDFVRAVYGASVNERSVEGLMVGDGPLRGVCEDFVRSHHAPVSFTGFLNQSQIVRAYASGDVLVLPSVGETWGMVVNEAMACGRPCLVSDRVGCGPDLVLPGETGVIFAHCDVPALAASMVKLARNPSQIAVMGKNAHNRLRSYSVDAAVEGVVQSLAVTVGPAEPVCAH